MRVDLQSQITLLHSAIGVARVDAELAHQLRAQGGPVPLQNVAEVVVLPPVFRHLSVDLAGNPVPDGRRIPAAGLTVSSPLPETAAAPVSVADSLRAAG